VYDRRERSHKLLKTLQKNHKIAKKLEEKEEMEEKEKRNKLIVYYYQIYLQCFLLL
jgi:hypothetical protein